MRESQVLSRVPYGVVALLQHKIHKCISVPLGKHESTQLIMEEKGRGMEQILLMACSGCPQIHVGGKILNQLKNCISFHFGFG